MAREALEITGLREAERRIDGVANRAKNPLPHRVASAIEREFKANEKRRFESGRGWRKLTPRWVQYKRTHGFDSRKLVQTGGLERTLTVGGTDLVYKTSHYAVEFGLERTRRYTAMARTRKPVMADRPSRQAVAMVVQLYVAFEGGR
jgi:hypothetical protein